ncbi:MAG: hypothetical protein JO352_16335 [Chloroflexi bacterium]|nr:hypothetical protein [Chloroflexota bacterium]
MTWISRLRSVAMLAAVALVTAIAPAQAAASRPFVVVASGLENPRGLRFGPDREFVAEAGRGGSQSTIGMCPQVPGPVGPYTGGLTARVSRIDERGRRSTVVDDLPSSINSVGDTVGAMDVTFVGDQLYVLIAGAGCSHGLRGTADIVNLPADWARRMPPLPPVPWTAGVSPVPDGRPDAVPGW